MDEWVDLEQFKIISFHYYYFLKKVKQPCFKKLKLDFKRIDSATC